MLSIEELKGVIDRFEAKPRRTFVKICGMKSAEDVGVALEAGADAVGLNYFPGSVRYLDIEKHSEWIRDFDNSGILRVAVVVNRTLDEIKKISLLPGIDLLQLHGDESPAYCESVRKLGIGFIKAIRIKSSKDMMTRHQYHSPLQLLDAWHSSEYGGTGQMIDVEGLNGDIIKKSQLPFLLAGGLDSDNVSSKMRKIHPWGVDTASGVESKPGLKDPARIRAFLGAVRNADK